ncbi:MAG: hypothetical protein AVO38_11135 [delta proteobacterium ML8_D]|jgi:hypothetical protein|nr:MAG: hypothetical protein AVO38_11135 [delta proteobacterium ML8_D]
MEYKLKPGQKLSEIIDFLPNGILDKKYPGIGATTVELKSKRNSILVVPTKALAYGKSAVTNNSLYVGSNFKDKVSPSTLDIQNYHKNDEIKFKKIIVVADSFPRVIQAIGDSVYNHYFLMVDEIDTFQSDSTFRSSMELCIDYYFGFKNRCVVSATVIPFSNEEFAAEEVNTVKIDGDVRSELWVVQTNNPYKYILEEINTIIQEHESKILIAHASITNIMGLIARFPTEYKRKTSILCGEGSRDEVGDFFGTLNDQYLLPKEINFITSAYFSGIDINEKFHSIIWSEYYPMHALLTATQILQIHGRCRRTLLTETLIMPNETQDEIDVEKLKEELEDTGNRILEADKCIENILDIKNDIIKFERNQLREQVVKNSDTEYTKLVRTNKDGNLVLATFNIDIAAHRASNWNDLYSDTNGLKAILDKDFLLKQIETKIYGEKGLPDDQERINNRNTILQKAIKNIKLNKSNIDELIKNAGGYERRIYEDYQILRKYLVLDDVINVLKDNLQDTRDDRKLKSVKLSAYVLFDPKAKEYLRQLKSLFSLDSEFTRKEIFAKASKLNNSPFTGQFEIHYNLKEESVIKYINQFLQTKKTYKKRDGELLFKIENYNPFGLKKKSKRDKDENPNYYTIDPDVHGV